MIAIESNLATGNGVSSIKDNGFYNTIHLTGNELKKAINQTENQKTKVLEFLKANQNCSFTKHEIKMLLVAARKINANTPESSISRTLSDLKDLGAVIKLKEMRPGEFDKPNHLWRLKFEAATLPTGIQTTLFS